MLACLVPLVWFWGPELSEGIKAVRGEHSPVPVKEFLSDDDPRGLDLRRLPERAGKGRGDIFGDFAQGPEPPQIGARDL